MPCTCIALTRILAPCPEQALRADKRIDAMFVYVTTADPAELAARQRARLKEAEQTMAKRLAWAKAACARVAGKAKGVFDHVVANVDDQEQVGVGPARRHSGAPARAHWCPKAWGP